MSYVAVDKQNVYLLIVFLYYIQVCVLCARAHAREFVNKLISDIQRTDIQRMMLNDKRDAAIVGKAERNPGNKKEKK